MALTLAIYEGREDSKSHETVSPGALPPPSVALQAEPSEDLAAPLPTSIASTAPVPAHEPALGASVSVSSLPSVAVSAKRAEPPRVASNQTPKAVAAAPSDSDALERETNLWRQANRARNDGQWAEALRLLDQHAREFPHGVLAVERTVERIVVLCHMGRREEARESSAFLATHPDSSLRRRVESNCGYEAASPSSTSSSAPKKTPPGTLNEVPEQAP
ncbi:hypothetical protein AKJ09_02226 [Labilithrix luteola]|uniref:Uncharacterized protein n=1 Tax=Labilithrix luteola TaxID=1391654 RepID=A0A0K1PPW5_9BACT|nr:hypothetical protein [Labilithrix luteola]AKU95562.1 hypothetical protein AKJ09_02226 [Labilithrix luteola]